MSCLCGQVGVFSPSHRNHYLNVTPNNLLRIYAPDGVSLSSTQLPPLVLVSTAENKNSTVQQIWNLSSRNAPSTCQLSPQTCFFFFLFLSRSPCCNHPLALPPPSSGSPCLGCSWCLTRTMTRGGNARREARTLEPQETLEQASAEAPKSLLGAWHRRSQAGMQVGRQICNKTCDDTERLMPVTSWGCQVSDSSKIKFCWIK